MKIQMLSTAAAIALMTTGAATAGEVGAHVGAEANVNSPGFVQLDTDASGSLDKSEIRADSNLEARWNELDENEDGTVSQSEFSAFEADNMEERADRIEDRAEDRADRMEDRADKIEDRADDRM